MEAPCLCKQFSPSAGKHFVYIYEHSVVVARVVVVRFQVLFVEINEVTIAYEMDYDISGFNMDGRAHAKAAIRPRYVDVVTRSFEHDLVNCVDDSIVGIFLLLLFNLSKLLDVFSLRYCSWVRLN